MLTFIAFALRQQRYFRQTQIDELKSLQAAFIEGVATSVTCANRYGVRNKPVTELWRVFLSVEIQDFVIVLKSC
jgi:hypothetical protein